MQLIHVLISGRQEHVISLIFICNSNWTTRFSSGVCVCVCVDVGVGVGAGCAAGSTALD